MNQYPYKIWLHLFSLLLLAAIGFAQVESTPPLDLNQATLAQLRLLPVSEEQAQAIVDWLEFIGPFESIFDLLQVRGIDYDTFLRVKPLVMVTPIFLDESAQRIEDNYYKVEQWISTEGASESFVDEWIDRLSNPVDVNDLGFFELNNLSGVSPVDALAIIKRQEQGLIRNRQDLRNTDNLSYYGFSNIEDFIRYEPNPLAAKFGGSYSTVVKNITLSQTPSDDPSSYSEFRARNYPLDVYHKLRLHWGTRLRFEMSYLRNLGEPTLYYNEGSFRIPRFKTFLNLDNQSLGPVRLNRLVIGDYTAAFGQGVVFEATDFFLPRKTGFAWRKRLNGISGNISRTTQYNLRGVAAELQWGRLIGTGFYSLTPRDAVVNADSSFSTLITMYPRLENGLYGGISRSLVGSVKELLTGANVKIRIIPGTYLGATLYQSLYDRPLELQVKNTLLNASGQSKYLTQIGNSADAEIAAAYESETTSLFWKKAQAVRRVYGFDFLSVFGNLSLQGEFARLDRDLKLFQVQKDPSAFVVSAFIQFDNFNFLVLYRNYELGFDNPYQRSFSNYQRFKGTIFEDIFYLQDPILGYLYSGTAQPQAEKGIYYSTRYQFHRMFVATVEHNIWQRVADKAQYNRLVLALEFRPVFNYRIRIRQKWQNRDRSNVLSPVGYQSNETRLEFIMRMSRYNEVRVLFSRAFTEFTPRPRLVINADTGGSSTVGNAGAPSDALGLTVTHNLNERIKLIGAVMTYSGFLWNFEDTDFRIFNTDTRAWHGWFTVFSRVSRDISVRFKYSFDLHAPLTNIVGGQMDLGLGDSNPVLEEINYQKFYSDFRLQIDYRF
jgi:DNA uptake protein ComE-like DNA-binding protein